MCNGPNHMSWVVVLVSLKASSCFGRGTVPASVSEY
jgi:hypothetical protein